MLAKSYLGGKNGLEDTVAKLYALMSPCRLCPRDCGVDRLAGEIGFCGISKEAKIASSGLHFGEEAPLVGRGGSGTIFLSGCNLGCVYCQNADISHGRVGRDYSINELAEKMLALQARGCHNINFVTPTHQTPVIVDAVVQAMELGLDLPIVYNCGGYEKLEVIKLLQNIVDIYMPDIKYGENEPGETYSKAPEYWDICQQAIREMHKQVGDLSYQENERTNIAMKGLLARHLVLPNELAGTRKVLEFLAGISESTFVNIMGQYRPCYEAKDIEKLNRRPSPKEMASAFSIARELKLTRGLTES